MKKSFLKILISLSFLLNHNLLGQQFLNTTLIGHNPNGPCHTSFAVGNKVYISNGKAIQILDIRNPASPVFLGQANTPSDIYDFFVLSDLVYVANGKDGLRIINVSDPRAPVEMGFYDTDDRAMGVYVQDNYAYVADGADGLRIIDVSDARAPKEVGFYDTDDIARDVYISNSYAYVADNDGWGIFDITNPTSPIKLYYSNIPYWVTGIYVNGNYVYLANTHSGLRIMDVSDPSAPLEIGVFNTKSSALKIYVRGNYAYVAAAFDGLRIVDVSNPTSPLEVGYYNAVRRCYDIYVSTNYAYLACDDDGLRIIDVSIPNAPKEVGLYITGGRALDVHVTGNYAYVAEQAQGLRIINVSQPNYPKPVGFYDTYEIDDSLLNYYSVIVSGDYAYVTLGSGGNSGQKGLRIINVSDPSAPQELGSCDTPGYAWDVYVSGDYAYVAADGLQIIDVSDPSAPQEVGFYDTPGSVSGVYVSGDYAYVAADGLQIIDVSDPSAPQEVGFYDTPGSAKDIYVSGSYAYVADWQAGLRIIYVSDPSAPQEVGFYDTPGSASGVYVSGNYAYVADSEAGLRIIDVSDPSAPQEVGFYDTPGFANDVYVSGSYTYVANGDSGLYILTTNYFIDQFRRIELSYHQNPAFSQYVHFIPACVPAPESIKLTLSGPSGTTPIHLNPISEGVYKGMYQFTTSGNYQLQLHAVKENLDTTITRSFTAQFMKASTGGTINSTMGTQLNIPAQALNSDMLLCSMPMSSSLRKDTLTIMQFGPDIDLLKKATISYPLNGEKGIVFCQLDDTGHWQKIPTFRSADNKQAIGYIQHLGKIAVLRTEETLPIVNQMELFQNYPNPFNPTTTIRYTLPKAAQVELIIYNTLGQKVRTLINGKQSPGKYSVVWDGRDDSGNPVASGIYLYQLKTKDFVQAKKMILLR